MASSLFGTLETTVEVKSSLEKFHGLLVGRTHHISNATPSNVESVELQEGEMGQVGAIIFWKYFHDGEAKVVKERIIAVDAENNKATYEMLEGDLMKEYKTFILTFQVTPKEGESGCIAHWHFEYEKISEEVAHPETLLQFAVEVSKEIDEYLMSEV